MFWKNILCRAHALKDIQCVEKWKIKSSQFYEIVNTFEPFLIDIGANLKKNLVFFQIRKYFDIKGVLQPTRS